MANLFDSFFCEVPNLTFELNVCLFVTQKKFKKKPTTTRKQNTILKTINNEYPNPTTTILNHSINSNRNLTFTIKLNFISISNLFVSLNYSFYIFYYH